MWLLILLGLNLPSCCFLFSVMYRLVFEVEWLLKSLEYRYKIYSNMFLICCLNCSVVQDKITETAPCNMRPSLRRNNDRKNPHCLQAFSIYRWFLNLSLWDVFWDLDLYVTTLPGCFTGSFNIKYPNSCTFSFKLIWVKLRSWTSLRVGLPPSVLRQQLNVLPCVTSGDHIWGTAQTWGPNTKER